MPLVPADERTHVPALIGGHFTDRCVGGDAGDCGVGEMSRSRLRGWCPCCTVVERDQILLDARLDGIRM